MSDQNTANAIYGKILDIENGIMITLPLIFHCDMTTLVMKEEEQFRETRSQQTRYNNPTLA